MDSNPVRTIFFHPIMLKVLASAALLGFGAAVELTCDGLAAAVAEQGSCAGVPKAHVLNCKLINNNNNDNVEDDDTDCTGFSPALARLSAVAAGDTDVLLSRTDLDAVDDFVGHLLTHGGLNWEQARGARSRVTQLSEVSSHASAADPTDEHSDDLMGKHEPSREFMMRAAMADEVHHTILQGLEDPSLCVGQLNDDAFCSSNHLLKAQQYMMNMNAADPVESLAGGVAKWGIIK